MGKRGRQPRPSHLKALDGVWEGRLNRDEILPPAGAVVAPYELDHAAAAIWDRLAPSMIEDRVLTARDVDSFAEFCRSAALYNRCADQAESEPVVVEGSAGNTVVNPAIRAMHLAQQMMRSTGQRFGMTPGDRAALRIDTKKSADSGAERLLS